MSKTTQKQFTYVIENGHYKLKYIDTNPDMNRVKSQILSYSSPNIQTINEEDNIPKLKYDFMQKSTIQEEASIINKKLQYFPKHFTSRKANIKNLDLDTISIDKETKDRLNTTQSNIEEFFLETPRIESKEKFTPEKKIKELQDDYRQIKSQLVEKQNENNYLKNQQIFLTKQKNNLEQKYNNVLAINKQLSEKMKLFSKGGQNLIKQENSLKQNYEQQFKEILKKVQVYSSEQKTLIRCNQKLLYQNQKVHQELQRLTIENEKLRNQKELKHFDKKQIYYQQRINTHQKQIDNILSKKKMQINSIKSFYQQQLRKYKNVIDDLNNQLDNLHKINLNSEKEKEIIKNAEINNREKIKELEKQIQKLNIAQNNGSIKIQQIKNRFEKKQIDLKNYYSDEFNRIKKQNDQLKLREYQYQKKCTIYQTQSQQFHNYHKKTTNQFQQKISHLQQQISRLSSVNQQLQNEKQSKYVDLENNYLEQLNDLNNQIFQQKQLINSYTKNMRKDQGDNPNQQINQLKSQLENKQKQNSELNERLYEIEIDYTNLKSEYYSYEIRTKNQILNLKGSHQRQLQECISSNQKLKNNEGLLIRKLKRLTQQNKEKDKILQKLINNKITSSQSEKQNYQNEQQLQQINIYKKQNHKLANLITQKDIKIAQLLQIIQQKTSMVIQLQKHCKILQSNQLNELQIDKNINSQLISGDQ